MTIYWERCSICGRYHAVKQCTLNPDIMVCPHCCLACPLRSKCPKPVWYPEIREKHRVPQAKKAGERGEAQKVLMDLLSKLKEG